MWTIVLSLMVRSFPLPIIASMNHQTHWLHISTWRKCDGSRVYLLSNGKKIEAENIQIIKVDQMIVFYNAMWSIITHSCIWGLIGGWFPHLYWQVFNGQKTVKYKNGQLSTTQHHKWKNTIIWSIFVIWMFLTSIFNFFQLKEYILLLYQVTSSFFTK